MSDNVDTMTVEGRALQPGDVMLFNFGRTATVTSVKLGRQFANLTFKEHPKSRVELHQEVLIERERPWHEDTLERDDGTQMPVGLHLPRHSGSTITRTIYGMDSLRAWVAERAETERNMEAHAQKRRDADYRRGMADGLAQALRAIDDTVIQ